MEREKAHGQEAAPLAWHRRDRGLSHGLGSVLPVLSPWKLPQRADGLSGEAAVVVFADSSLCPGITGPSGPAPTSTLWPLESPEGSGQSRWSSPRRESE